jgi:hypothetical protein
MPGVRCNPPFLLAPSAFISKTAKSALDNHC